MATKPPPARRTSSLAGTHPIGDDTSDITTPAASVAPSPAATTARTMSAEKITASIDAEVMEDARNAFWRARDAGRYAVLSDFYTEAIAEKVQRLRDELNHGEPFPRRPAELRRGRRPS